MRRVVLVLGIVFTTAGALLAQVHIQEKAKITPRTAYKPQADWGLPSGILLLCNSTITVTVADGYDDLYDPIIEMDLVLFTPEWMMIMPDALHKFKQSWTSPEFKAGSILNFGMIEHHASGYVDTAGARIQELSIFDSTFGIWIDGRFSNGAWGGLYIDVDINTTLRNAFVMQPGVIHFGVIWWHTDGRAAADSGRLEIQGPCPDRLDVFRYGNNGAITGEVEDSVAGTYIFYPAIRKVDTRGTNAFYYLCANTGSQAWSYGISNMGDVDSVNAWYSLVFGPQMLYTTPYSSKFAVTATVLYDEGPYLPGKIAVMDLSDVYDCSTTRWSLTDPITLRILSGSQYASFHTLDPDTWADIKLGSTANAIGQSIRDGWYALIADGIKPDSVTWIVVEADGSGLSSVDSIQIFPSDIVVTFDPPVISPGDTASIVLKKVNPDGTLDDFPPPDFFEVGFTSGEEYGTILLSNGNTGGYFVNVRQPFEFVAADSITADSVTVGIRVGPVPELPTSTKPGDRNPSRRNLTDAKLPTQMNSQASVMKQSTSRWNSVSEKHKSVSLSYDFVYNDDYGIGWVKIKKKKPILKIVDHAPWSIWPDLPPTGKGITRGGDLPGYNHKRGFVISVTDEEGNPVENAAVEIIHDYEQGTGGMRTRRAAIIFRFKSYRAYFGANTEMALPLT